jgi:hypothetical protein
MALDFLQSIGSGVSKLVSKASNTAFDLLDPANARRAISGLMSGGKLGLDKMAPNIGWGSSGTSAATAASEDDWRVRVSLADGAKIFYKDPATNQGLMRPLVDTNGVVWPYTPSISVTHTANYSTAMLTHSNYPAHFYNSSDVADIQVSGEFTVQSIDEGQYLMAAIYFFRSATKMFFGTGDNVGQPPPIVFLDGYGSHYFPHVPCVITNFTHTLPNEVDYIQVPITSTVLTETPIDPSEAMNSVNPPENRGVNNSLGDVIAPNWNLTGVAGNEAAAKKLAENNSKADSTRMSYSSITSTTRVPTVSTVSVTLRPIYSRKNLHERFDLNKFAGGALLADKKKGFGGFL